MIDETKFSPKRLAWLCLGGLCVVLGAIGVIVPLLPTTIFMIIAAYAFARSSPRLHQWLMSHRVFGPLINDWNAHGVVSVQAKWMSSLSMILVFALSAYMGAPRWVLVLQAIILAAVAIFLLTRPSKASRDLIAADKLEG